MFIRSGDNPFFFAGCRVRPSQVVPLKRRQVFYQAREQLWSRRPQFLEGQMASISCSLVRRPVGLRLAVLLSNVKQLLLRKKLRLRSMNTKLRWIYVPMNSTCCSCKMGFLLYHLNNTLTFSTKCMKSTAIPRAFILLLCYSMWIVIVKTCGYEDATKGPREDLGIWAKLCIFLKRIFGCVVH